MLEEEGLFHKIGGGFPHNFHAIRDMVEKLDPEVSSSPLLKRKREVSVIQEDGDGDDIEPASKRVCT